MLEIRYGKRGVLLTGDAELPVEQELVASAQLQSVTINFHHPHPTVLARLKEHHVQIRRTDERGLSTFLTDGDNVQISSFR